MKFTIRDLMFVMLIAGVLLGWLVDHRRAMQREAKWKAIFDDAMRKLSVHSTGSFSFETPAGTETVNRPRDLER